jgi:hypothetical protein
MNFCRALIYNPGSIINRLSEEMYQLYDLVDLRTARHKLDWKVSEGIKVLFRGDEGRFIVHAPQRPASDSGSEGDLVSRGQG